VLPAELPSAIERLQNESKEQKRALLALQNALAGYEAAALADAAPEWPTARVVLEAVEGDAVRLKALATAVAERPGLLAVLVSRSTPVLVVAARATDVSVSCQELIGAVVKEFGGRGGGKPDLAQCGGVQAAPEAVLGFVRARLGNLM
jgi:alanyl-tRNA synthetase